MCRRRWFFFSELDICLCICFLISRHVIKAFTAPTQAYLVEQKQQNSNDDYTYPFSVALSNPRPQPESFADKLKELWNDPRPISAVLLDQDRSAVVGQIDNEDIPYCIVSDEFQIDDEEFQILLYPRGRFIGRSSNTGKVKLLSDSSSYIAGSASAYLRYLPKQYGDEVDVAWKLRLCETKTNEEGHTITTPLSIMTSGGMPKSNTTWSAAMTLCTELESSESVGRAQDWGSSIFSANEVCNALLINGLVAEGEMTIFDKRQGESSFFTFPPRGAVGSILASVRRNTAAASSELVREFRA